MSFFRWMQTKLLKIICTGLLALIALPLLPVNAQEQRGGCSISPALAIPKINKRCSTSGRSRHSNSGSAGRSSGSSRSSRSSGPQEDQLSEPWLELPNLYIFSLGVGPIFQLSPADSNIYGLRINVGYGTNEEVWGLDLGTINSATRFYGIQLGGWNKIGKVVGLQAGLVNSTTSAYGPSLGDGTTLNGSQDSRSDCPTPQPRRQDSNWAGGTPQARCWDFNLEG
jgi:hypothetical protein